MKDPLNHDGSVFFLQLYKQHYRSSVCAQAVVEVYCMYFCKNVLKVSKLKGIYHANRLPVSY